MGFYLVVLACLYGAIFSFTMMITVKQKPPEAWSDWCHSKSRFAKWLEKKLEHSRFLGPLLVDRFHLVGFMSFFSFFVVSAALFVVDFGTGLSITKFLGTTGIFIALLFFLLAPPFYEAFLVIWWSIADRNASRNQQIKQLKKITKRNKKK